MRAPLTSVFVPALVLVLSAAAHAGIVVVDPAGGDGAAALQAAVDSAHDGDVLLLEAGDYVGSGLPPLTISGRSLTIVADTGLAPLPVRAIKVDALPVGGLVLRGLRIAGPQFLSLSDPHAGASLDIYTGAGAPPSLVWVEDCEIVGAADSPASDPNQEPTAVSLNGSLGSTAGALVAVRSSLVGAKGGMTAVSGVGGRGVSLQPSGDCEAALFECTLVGGDGGDAAAYVFAADGGTALFIGSGQAYAAATSMLGGGSGANSLQSAASGAGLDLLFPWTQAWLRGCQVEAGPALSAAGIPSPDVAGAADKVQVFAAVPRSVALPAVLRELEPAAISIHGLRGDLVGLLVSPAAQYAAPLQGLQGPLLVDVAQAPELLVVGSIAAADGSLQVPFVMPRLPVGVDVLRLFAQGVFAGTDGVTLGSGSAFCWIPKDL